MHTHGVLDAPDPICVVSALLQGVPGGEFVVYERGPCFHVAVGVRARIAVERDELVVTTSSGVERVPCTDPFAQTGAALRRLGAGAAYGYAGFDLARFYFAYRKMPTFPSLQLVIPEVDCRFDGERLTIESSTHDPAALLASVRAAVAPPRRAPTPLTVDDAAEEGRFATKIATALEAIRADRLEKVIISRAVRFEGQLDILATYANARQHVAPRRFAFHLGTVSGVGNSPAPLLVGQDRRVTTQPLAGTKPRGTSPEDDARLTRELFADAKEVREHAMSARRAMAELQRVAGPGGAVLTELMGVVKYRFTQHLASIVRADLAEGKTVWDALREVFPAVTATGVEKEPAIELIDQLEDEPRGVYAGAVGVFDETGIVDAAIALRSVFDYGDGKIALNGGAGIVVESDPHYEFVESREKLKTMLLNVVCKGR